MAIHFKGHDFFFQHYCDQYLDFHHVIFLFLLGTRVSLSSVHNFYYFIIEFDKCSELYATSITFP